MPTNGGIPITPGVGPPGNNLNPVDWIDHGPAGGMGGAQQSALMRGTGGAFNWWHRRATRGADQVAQGFPMWLQSRPYNRGAQAFAPKLGQLLSNPIGAGVYAPYKLPVIAGPGARYQFGAIWFDVQTVPTSVHISPTMPVESMNALLAQSYVAAMYPTTG